MNRPYMMRKKKVVQSWRAGLVPRAVESTGHASVAVFRASAAKTLTPLELKLAYLALIRNAAKLPLMVIATRIPSADTCGVARIWPL
jgi:hypothetical protein